MRNRILIVADDLTGALDSAVGFAARGWCVNVAHSPDAVTPALAQASDVLAINTASRELDEAAAVAQVTRALSCLAPDMFRIVLKKVDSRLKGHIASETAVVARWSGRARQVVCPAIPAMGRTVRGGLLQGHGIDRPVAVAPRCGEGCVVADAGHDGEIDALVADAPEGPLWVGARGLAFALARRCGVGRPDIATVHAPLMIANGSRDRVTLAQIAAIGDRVPLVAAPDGQAPDGQIFDGQTFNGQAPEQTVSADALVVTITDGGGAKTGAQAALCFAQSVVRIARDMRPASLLLCGGESAYATLDQLGIHSLQVIAELRAGLPLCLVQTPWGPVRIVTKSGGFGGADLLAQVLAAARQDPLSEPEQGH